jgi:hypothetical protein
MRNFIKLMNIGHDEDWMKLIIETSGAMDAMNNVIE